MAPVLEKYQKNALIFQAKELLKVFRNSNPPVEVLKDLNFELRKKDTVSIIGASGIGKSTFLHIMGTLDRPDGGSLLYEGKNVFDYTETQLANFRNQCIGFVFQFHHLLSDFTALENAMMPALIQEMNREEAIQTAEKLLVRVGLKDRLGHKVGELSGGEQQRVAI
ncbi:MAG: ATP-binding cassette domain-containing protein, partial [Proteobacteria bacterium]|nr:ATP-binding cassette domain-containing protein [Pseudomonadota bacterium]